MNIADLLEEIRDGGGADAYYEVLIDFAPAGSRDTDWRFACGSCGREVEPSTEDGACPEHAPREVPGLARTECWAEPKHSPTWTYNGDHAGYGNPCPHCRLTPYIEAEIQARQCRHWAWRRWRVTGWALSAAFHLGITVNAGGSQWGDGHNWCRSLPGLRGARTYILGIRIQQREEGGY